MSMSSASVLTPYCSHAPDNGDYLPSAAQSLLTPRHLQAWRWQSVGWP